MAISGLGARISDGTLAHKAILRTDRGGRHEPDDGGFGRLEIGLLAAGGVGLVGGLALRAGGMGRVGTGLAAISGALLGITLLTGCGTKSSPPRDPVPGDEGPPGEDVRLVADSYVDLPKDKDTTNPAPEAYVAESGTRDAREGVVQIRHSTGMGSGWVVEPGTVITNYHVAQGYGQVEVLDHQGEAHEGTVKRLDRTHDLAIVSVPTLDDEPLQMDDAIDYAEDGETTGYPGGTFHNDAAIAGGTVDIKDDGRRRETIMFVGRSAQGVSGGAVINGAGEVMGTSFAVGELGSTSEPTEFVLGIPNDQVRGFLAEFKAAEAAATPDATTAGGGTVAANEDANRR